MLACSPDLILTEHWGRSTIRLVAELDLSGVYRSHAGGDDCARS